MKKKPLFLSNPFPKAMAASFERALTISAFTDSALAADPARAAEYAIYHPLHLALETAYADWKAGKGSQKGATTTLRALLKDLPRQVRSWDYDIQAFAPKDSAEYEALFPNGRTPFGKGTQQARMGEVSTLGKALGLLSPQPAIKSVVDDYYAELVAANAAQKGKVSLKEGLFEAMEAARDNAANGLYNVMVKLMGINYLDTDKVEKFFDMELIRRRPQKNFTGRVAQVTYYTIVKRTMKETAQVTLRNNGALPLTFYFAHTNHGSIPGGVTGVTVPSSGVITVQAGQLGHPGLDKYLSVYNPSEIIEGEWAVEIQ
jgi:hypothetical protein